MCYQQEDGRGRNWDGRKGSARRPRSSVVDGDARRGGKEGSGTESTGLRLGHLEVCSHRGGKSAYCSFGEGEEGRLTGDPRCLLGVVVASSLWRIALVSVEFFLTTLQDSRVGACE